MMISVVGEEADKEDKVCRDSLRRREDEKVQ